MDEGRLGAGTGGVWTAADARAVGLSDSAVQRRVRQGHWQVLRRGVYTWGGCEPDARQRAWAAVLAAGGPGRARAAGRTAARVLGLPLIDDADPLLPVELREQEQDDVVAAGPSVARGLHAARLQLGHADRARLHGLPLLMPRAVLVDLARVLRPDALVCALDGALHRGLVTLVELEAEVAARAGRPHVGRLRAALALSDGRAESPLETLSRLLLQPVLPGLVPQVRVCDPRGRVVARLDLADEALRFGVEADGARWHRGEAALAADRRRERQVEPYGWDLERVTWWDVRRGSPATRDRVLRAAHRRRAA